MERSVKPKTERKKKLSTTTISNNEQGVGSQTRDSGDLSSIKQNSHHDDSDSSNIFNFSDSSKKELKELEKTKKVRSEELKCPPSPHFGLPKQRKRRENVRKPKSKYTSKAYMD